jgi:hypothetical protein
MHREVLGGEEPSVKIALVRGALFAEEDEVLVHAAPIRSRRRVREQP